MTQELTQSSENDIKHTATQEIHKEDNVVSPEEKQKGKKRSAVRKDAKAEKKPKIEKVAGDEAEKKILQYMKEQNRPYSVQNVFDNLHGTIGKTSTQRIMDQLALEKKLLCKEYGKVKVYLYEQTSFGESTGTENEASVESQISALKAEVAQLENQVKNAKQSVQKAEDKVKQLLSIAPLEEEILADEKQLAQYREAVNTTSSAAHPVTIEATLKQHQKLHESWHRRKKACESLMRAMCPSLETTVEAIIEELGLDRDEDCIPPTAYTSY